MSHNYLSKRSYLLCLFFVILVGGVAAKTQAVGDLAPAAKRRQSVELALKLAAIAYPPPLSADLVLPFNPVAFSQPDPDEQRAVEQATANLQAQQAAPGQTRGGTTTREQLVEIASQIKPTGSVIVRGEPILFIKGGNVKIGAKFTVNQSGVDYILELIGIDRTTFTLRLNGEEITRPIKTTKTSP
jgi:hypothetical protein